MSHATEERLAAGARTLVQVNGRVQTGERVLIVTDRAMQPFATRIAAAAAEAGGEVVVCTMPVRERDGQEPPEVVRAALQAAQVIFTPVSRSITHTKAMRAALEQGARALLMTAYTDEILASDALIATDFAAQAAVCRRMGSAFTSGTQVRLTTERGTDLTFSIAGRRANVLTNVPEPGELAPVPDIEVNVVPVEGTANGTMVFDASVPYLGIGVLAEPIECEVENGFITRMSGGVQARQLADVLRAYQDPNCYNIAELGVGLNPNARLTGVMLEDEGVIGTIHIGIGTSLTLGGSVVAPMHYDLLMWNPVIEVDGAAIQRGREILV